MDLSTSRDILNNLLNTVLVNTDLFEGTAYLKYFQYLPIFLIGLISSLILTPIIGQIALKYDITYKPGIGRNQKSFDNPEKALHEGVTPSLGGLIVTIPILIAMFVFFKIDSFTLPIFIALFILIIGSALDDIFNLPAKTQLLYQLIASIIIAFSVINLDNLGIFNLNLDLYTWNFSLFGIEQSLCLPGDIILVLWMLVCINAYKWTAGSPGIIECNSLIIFALIFVIGIRFQSIFASTLSILAVGCLVIFLWFALPPQKIMTGSVGKTCYGFLICVLALIADAKLSTTLMLLAMPLIDFAYVLIKRALIYKPKSFGELMKISGADHFHHQLIKIGLGRRTIVLIEASITLLLGSVAVLSVGAKRYFALIFVGALAILLVVFINMFARRKKEKKGKEESPESKYSY